MEQLFEAAQETYLPIFQSGKDLESAVSGITPPSSSTESRKSVSATMSAAKARKKGFLVWDADVIVYVRCLCLFLTRHLKTRKVYTSAATPTEHRASSRTLIRSLLTSSGWICFKDISRNRSCDFVHRRPRASTLQRRFPPFIASNSKQTKDAWRDPEPITPRLDNAGNFPTTNA